MQQEQQMPFYALDPLVHDLNELSDLDSSDNSEFTPKLYSFITSAIQPPYSLSIHGSWGAGKTTLMMELKKQFKDDGYPVFWFNPWEFEQADDILHTFLSQLTRTADKRWEKPVKAAGILGLTLLGTSIDLVARLTTGNKLNLKNVDYISEKASADFKKTFEAFEGKYLDQHPLEILREDFKSFTVETAKKHEEKPLIVFLDDLDRCLPENALTLLEAIKNLFVIKGAKVIFITGIDTHIARQFIIERYKGLDSSFAYNYFKKIFNFTVSVPSLSTENYSELLQKRYDEMIPAFSNIELPSNFENLLTSELSRFLVDGGVKSIRQIYNVLQEGIFFFLVNPPKRVSDAESYDIIYLGLLTLKEGWPDLFEELQKEARRNPEYKLITVLNAATTKAVREKKEAKFTVLLESIVNICHTKYRQKQPTPRLLLDI
jgi:GTPase SAR1 family protein